MQQTTRRKSKKKKAGKAADRETVCSLFLLHKKALQFFRVQSLCERNDFPSHDPHHSLPTSDYSSHVNFIPTTRERDAVGKITNKKCYSVTQEKEEEDGENEGWKKVR